MANKSKSLDKEKFLEQFKKLSFQEKTALLLSLKAEAKSEGDKLVAAGNEAANLLSKIENGEANK